MSGQKNIARWKWMMAMLVALIAFGFGWNNWQAPIEPNKAITFDFQIRSLVEDVYELHYDTLGLGYQPNMRSSATLMASTDPQSVQFEIPSVQDLRGIRLDLGNLPLTLDIHGLTVQGPFRTERFDAQEIDDLFPSTHNIDSIIFNDNTASLTVHCGGPDPYLAIHDNSMSSLEDVLSTRRPVLRPFLKAISIALLSYLLTLVFLSIKWRSFRRAVLRSVSPKKWEPVLLIPFLISAAIGAAVFAFTSKIELDDRAIHISVLGTFEVDDEAQIYYTNKKGGFTKDHYVMAPLKGSPGKQIVNFTIPRDSVFSFLRFDPGSRQDTVYIDRMILWCGDASYIYEAIDLEYEFDHNEQMAPLKRVDDRLMIAFRESDPFIFTDIDLSDRISDLRARTSTGPLPWLFAIIIGLFFWSSLSKHMGSWLTGLQATTADLSIAALFLALIMTPMVLNLTGIELKGENTEKRILAGKPTFKIRNASAFPDQYAAYFKDNFETRELLYRWNSILYTKVLKTSPRPDRVLLGKNDWMFLIQKHALDQYQELCNINEEDLLVIARNLQARKDWLAKQGIPYVLIVPPQKATMYPELLPDNIMQVGSTKCLDLFKDYVKKHTDVVLIDLREALAEMKKEHQVYYATDIHWNTIGGYTGYYELMRHLGTVVPNLDIPLSIDAFKFVMDTNYHADLSMMLAINDIYPRITPMFIGGSTSLAEDAPKRDYPNSAFFQYAPVIKQTPDTAAPRLLMFRDSFAVYMIPHLSEHFNRSVYIWSPVFIPEVVIEERPDVVVQEMMEIFIHRLIQDDLRLPEVK